jgi:hypothetical protein
MEATEHRFQLPVTARRALIELADMVFETEEPIGTDKVPERIRLLVELFGGFVGQADNIESFWTIKITNGGQDKAEGVELYVPSAIQIDVRRSGVSQVVEGNRASIGEVRPSEKVDVLAWGHHPIMEEPSIIQSRGRATVRVKRP